MSLLPLHPARRDRVAEIDGSTYNLLMSELSLAGAQEAASYGFGRLGLHPQHGQIAVSRVEWPARLWRHPGVAYFIECTDAETLTRVMDRLGQADTSRAVPSRAGFHRA